MKSKQAINSNRRLRRSFWIPLLLLIYFSVLCIYCGGDWIKSGHTWRLVISCVFELIIVVALYFSLRRREHLEEKRRSLNENLSNHIEKES
ncbi:MAG: hypothetical protein NC328_05750 [Muribaculum sp.]|nr:hypothetical protein [Muribaculum sp.]